ncbi:cysteine desulfurase family protein [Sphingomonas sp. CFBP9021]|uniref:cysteine desulfurase family protein n=1 Tax=Sphingomonas sp. CFBP9021 TaxID=3096534 RepID=UPI002A6A5ECE|nr:cysteine desulfurase family protein [Sphingomonas sp. CFBP9021]MDY0969080.1 cysteine desulfurase family protein [Sphingomonas sp. CFBP9021]
MDEPVYLDGFATTPLAPEARDAMIVASSHPGNAGSPHYAGARASAILDQARHDVAALIGANASEIVFTSGATEADNLAVRGIAMRALKSGNSRRKIIVSAIEHKAVLEAAESLRTAGFSVRHAPVNAEGIVDIDVIEGMIDAETLLVSIMLANNETGALQPVGEVAAIAHRSGALLHCDAAQAVGKIPVDVDELDVDYMSISAHKMYGPMGVGALYVASGAPKPVPLSFGGGQESSIRPGTEPTYLLAGFGAAARLAEKRLQEDMTHSRELADAFRSGLVAEGLSFDPTTGDMAVLPGTVSIVVHGAEGDGLVSSLSPFASVSTGSACTSGQVMPSHVLIAMGFSQVVANSVVRLYFGRYNTTADVLTIAPAFAKAAFRQHAPLDGAASRM